MGAVGLYTHIQSNNLRSALLLYLPLLPEREGERR